MSIIKRAIKLSRKHSEWFTMSKDNTDDNNYKYFVRVYTPTEPDEIVYSNSEQEAIDKANHYDAMQPDNIYEVASVDGEGEEHVIRTISNNVGR